MLGTLPVQIIYSAYGLAQVFGGHGTSRFKVVRRAVGTVVLYLLSVLVPSVVGGIIHGVWYRLSRG
jgi:hypothetical protein